MDSFEIAIDKFYDDPSEANMKKLLSEWIRDNGESEKVMESMTPLVLKKDGSGKVVR